MLKTAEKFEWLRVSKKAECHTELVSEPLARRSQSDSAFFVSMGKSPFLTFWLFDFDSETNDLKTISNNKKPP